MLVEKLLLEGIATYYVEHMFLTIPLAGLTVLIGLVKRRNQRRTIWEKYFLTQ